MGIGEFCGNVCDGRDDISDDWESVDNSDDDVCIVCGNCDKCGDFEWEKLLLIFVLLFWVFDIDNWLCVLIVIYGGVFGTGVLGGLYGGICGGKCNFTGPVDGLDDDDCGDVWFDAIDIELFELLSCKWPFEELLIIIPFGSPFGPTTIMVSYITLLWLLFRLFYINIIVPDA